MRPVLAGASAPSNRFGAFVRSGATVEMKAFTGVTGDAGGYAVPREIDREIDAVLKSASPIRSIANVVTVGSAGYRKLITTGGTPSGWAVETGPRPETASPVFTELAPPMGELYANPAASQAMLDDAAFDVEEWLAGEIANEFAKAEGAAFVSGSGVNRPKGFLTSAVAAAGDATRTAIGGPLGGAVGALLGRGVDRAVLGGRRQGPRLTELKVQTSSYGTQIPRLFGTMRVAGTVIWATDLTETRSTSGGKGRPRVTNYAYAANVAVALSARPVLGIRRIWADGKLLRGAAGDWKVRTGFRLHLGGENQPVDPLLASVEGAMAPAHRGVAYAVFEGLELAEYGNRIPSLSFEVVADDGPVASGAVVRALTGEVAAADAGLALGGFAAAGGSVRAVLETLAEASGAWFAGEGEGLAFRTGGAAQTVADRGRATRAIAGAGVVPGAVSVAHYDAARDYQAGLQRARAPGGGVREERVEVAAVLDAPAAKAVAEAVLLRREAERVRRTVTAGLDALAIAPGAVVAIAGETGVWRVAKASLEGMAVVLELLPLVRAPEIAGASGGRVLAQDDAVAGRTLVAAFEAPALGDVALGAPVLLVAAAGEGAGWRRADLLLSTDGGASWDEAGSTAAPAVMGVIEVAPDKEARRLRTCAMRWWCGWRMRVWRCSTPTTRASTAARTWRSPATSWSSSGAPSRWARTAGACRGCSADGAAPNGRWARKARTTASW